MICFSFLVFPFYYPSEDASLSSEEEADEANPELYKKVLEVSEEPKEEETLLREDESLDGSYLMIVELWSSRWDMG